MSDVSSEELSAVYHEAVKFASDSGSELSTLMRVRMVCPWCNGGTNNEGKTLTLYRIPVSDKYKHSDGVFFKCWRASCGRRGFVGFDATVRDFIIPTEQEERGCLPEKAIYDKPTKALSKEDVKDFQLMYPAITFDALRYHSVLETCQKEYGAGTVVMPLYPYRSNSNSRQPGGYHLRSMWPGCPKETKWNSFFTVDAHKGSWFDCLTKETTDWRANFFKSLSEFEIKNVCVVVEDALSGIVVSQYLPTYCLLGATMSSAHLLNGFKDFDAILLWTDPDLWDARPGTNRIPVVDLIKRFSLAAPVVPRKLPMDPKYLTAEQINSYILEDVDSIIYGDSM